MLASSSTAHAPAAVSRRSCVCPALTDVVLPERGSSRRCSTTAAASHADIASLLRSSRTVASSPNTTCAEAAAPTATRAAMHAAAPPMAVITRFVMVVAQPQTFFRGLAGRRIPMSGPVSLLLFLLGLVFAAVAAVRHAFMRHTRRCMCCRGYGLIRCNLCNGQGKVDWRAKFSYSDSCPLCMSRRFIDCPECGGHYHRPIFCHVRRRDSIFAPQ